jgi:transcriptional regulator with XRE-family HTH domain
MPGIQLTIAERVVLVRRRLDETQEKFGLRFDVKKLTVNQWESGGSIPTQEHQVRLKKLFQEVLEEEDESEFESAAYQLLLPFDQPVRIDFRVSSATTDRVRVSVGLRRKVS